MYDAFTFLSTPSARRATSNYSSTRQGLIISIHALREEGDDNMLQNIGNTFKFLSTPSARRATSPIVASYHITDISIHALREEGDAAVGLKAVFDALFLSTPSARRATNVLCLALLPHSDFYPRPPRGGRPVAAPAAAEGEQISIHALREEGDQGGERSWTRNS